VILLVLCDYYSLLLFSVGADHVREVAPEIVVVELGVEEFANGSERLDSMMAEVLAEDGGPGDEHVENHEDEQEDEEALAELAGDAFDEVREEGVDDFDEDETEDAPESHDWDGGAAGDVHDLVGVVPGGGAGESFLEKAEAVFDGAADEGGVDEDLPVFEFFAEENPAHEGRAEAVDDVERPPDDAAVGHPDAGAGREVGLAVDEEVFVDGAEDGADQEDEEEFFEGEAFGERMLFGGFG